MDGKYNPFRELYQKSLKTQEEIALDLGMSPGTIERIVNRNGPAENLNMSTLRRYLAYFNWRLVVSVEPLNSREASDGTNAVTH